VGIVRTYKDGLRMLYEGTATVIVAARRDHIDPGDLPRVEFAGDSGRIVGRSQTRPALTAKPGGSRTGRPQIIRN
jgi:hypothetical protein